MRNFLLHGITEIVISDLPHYRPRHAPYCPCPPTSLVFNPEHCHLILPIFVSSFAYHYAFLYFTLGIETISNFLQSSAGLAKNISNDHYKLQLKIYIFRQKNENETKIVKYSTLLQGIRLPTPKNMHRKRLVTFRQLTH